MASPQRLTERGMVRRATPLILAALSLCPEQVRIVHELPIGHSIADVVILRSRDDLVRPVAPLTVAESVVLAALRQLRSARPETIGRHTFMSAEEVLGVLRGRLSRWRLFKSRDRGVVEARASWVETAEIIAVEAKLTRWREALVQAASYRKYANRSFVMLPEKHAEVATQHAGLFRAAGVGLLSYSSRGVACKIAGRQARLHDSWHREFAISRV